MCYAHSSIINRQKICICRQENKFNQPTYCLFEKKKKNLESYIYSRYLVLVWGLNKINHLSSEKNYVSIFDQRTAKVCFYPNLSIALFSNFVLNAFNAICLFKECFISNLAFIFLSNIASGKRCNSWVTVKTRSWSVEILITCSIHLKNTFFCNFDGCYNSLISRSSTYTVKPLWTLCCLFACYVTEPVAEIFRNGHSGRLRIF